MKNLLTKYRRKLITNQIVIALTLSVAPLAVSAASNNDGADHSASQHVSTKAMSPAVSAQLQGVLDTIIIDERAKFPGIILRIESPEGVFNGVAGVSDLASKKEIDSQAKFRAGSILKPYISTVILQLIEDGKLTLDDKLINLLPKKITDLFEYSNEITLKMLLNHTSGLADWANQSSDDLLPGGKFDTVWRDQELLEMAAKMGTNHKPGERWEYTNTGFTLLGLIIEDKTNLSWRENIRQRIFAKLALKNTFLPEPGNIKMSGSYVHGYEKLSTGITDLSDLDPSMAGAAGGHALVTNTKDLGIFMKALISGQFFKKDETLTAMLTGVNANKPGRTYGLGLGRYTMPNGSYAYGHTGSTAGYASFIFYFPEEDIVASSAITFDQGAAIPLYLIPAIDIVFNALNKKG